MMTTPARRFAVLPLEADRRQPRYVIYDRLTERITDGVYMVLDTALAVAAYNEERGIPTMDGTPTAETLGLLFPESAGAQKE